MAEEKVRWSKEVSSTTTSTKEGFVKNGFSRCSLTLKLLSVDSLLISTVLMQSYPQGHWIEYSKKIGPKMQEKALGFPWVLG